jgi:SAM-dependent methyltransferase
MTMTTSARGAAPSDDEHRVASHLRVDAGAYDAEIRRFIPGYDAMIAEVIELVDGAIPASGGLVVDLGTGTGALAGAILSAIPRAAVVLVDVDPAMLTVAQARVADHGARATVQRATFEAALAVPAAGAARPHAIVASLALHHVRELSAKRALYSQIRGALAEGGVFANADAAIHDGGAERARAYARWAAGMAQAGIGAAEAEAHFAQWGIEDRYYPIAVELAALGEAGFARPECFWRRGPIAVLGGYAAA